MKDYNEIIEQYNKLRENQKIDLQSKLIGEISKRNEIINAIASNDEYISWLIEYTKEIGVFYDDDEIIDKYKTDMNIKNAKNLCLLYKAIDKYAQKKLIYPYPCAYGNFYQITYNDIGFEIGFNMGQGTAFFCNRTAVNENFIDFNDIIEFNKKENKQRKK